MSIASPSSPALPPGSSTHAHLINLPVELQSQIAGLLVCADMCSLRLTCRRAERAIFDAFTRDYFRKKQFYIASESLSALVDIASTPRLGDSMRHLIIGLDRYDISTIYKPRQQHTAQDVADTRAVGSASRRALDQRSLITSGCARDMLEAAMAKLANLATVEIRDYSASGRDGDPHKVWASYGASTARRETKNQPAPPDDRFTTAPYSWASNVTSIVAAALARSGNTSVTKLDVNTRKTANAVNGDFLCVSPVLAPVLDPMLARLTDVFLHVDFSEPTVPVRETKRAVAAGRPPINMSHFWNMCHFLNRLEGIRHLRINTSRRHDDHSSVPFLEWFAQPAGPPLLAPLPDIYYPNDTHAVCELPPSFSRPIQQLELGRFMVTHSLLLAIVHKFRHSLTSLSLHRIYLREDGYNPMSLDTHSAGRDNIWARFFKDLVRMPDLELRDISIKLAMQPYKRRTHTINLGSCDGPRRYHGEDWRDWLNALVVEMAQSWPKPTPDQSEAEDNDDDDDDIDDEGGGAISSSDDDDDDDDDDDNAGDGDVTV